MAAIVTRGYNPLLPLVGRLLIGALFLVTGIWKATHFAGTVGYMARMGLPAAESMAMLAVGIEVLGGILLMAGWKARAVAWLLMLFVIVATFAGHRFWELPEGQFFNQMNHFLKNLAIVGGLLMITAFGPGTASVDKN